MRSQKPLLLPLVFFDSLKYNLSAVSQCFNFFVCSEEYGCFVQTPTRISGLGNSRSGSAKVEAWVNEKLH